MNPLAPLVALGVKLSVKAATVAGTAIASAHAAATKGLGGAEGKLINDAQPGVKAGLAAAGKLAASASGLVARVSLSVLARFLGRV